MEITKELINELMDVLTKPDIPETDRFQLLHCGLAACAIKFMIETNADSFTISSDLNPKNIDGKYKSIVSIERLK